MPSRRAPDTPAASEGAVECAREARPGGTSATASGSRTTNVAPWFGPALWALMLAFPFPYIANIAGWMTAELGRQPWLVYGLLRTSEGYSSNVSSGSTWFTLLGYMGMYALLGLSFVFLLQRLIAEGPAPARAGHAVSAA